MRTSFQMQHRGAWLLVLLTFWLVPAHFTIAYSDDYKLSGIIACEDLLVDGTQLVGEAKQVVADLLHVSPSLVTASYCCQPPDGRFKYNVSYGTQSGFVYFVVVNGQIIEDDVEGF